MICPRVDVDQRHVDVARKQKKKKTKGRLSRGEAIVHMLVDALLGFSLFFHILQLVLKVDVHGLDSGVARPSVSMDNTREQGKDDALVQRILAQLSPNATLLESTKRHAGIQVVYAVNPCGTRLQSVSRLDCTAQVLREHGCSETVQRVIGLLHHIFLVLEFDDNTDGTENFFSDNFHVWGGVGEDGGFDEVAFGAFTLTASLDLCTSVLARLDVTHNAL